MRGDAAMLAPGTTQVVDIVDIVNPTVAWIAGQSVAGQSVHYPQQSNRHISYIMYLTGHSDCMWNRGCVWQAGSAAYRSIREAL